MRLMCPNCDAEYEVDASAIPLSGRDVQCSNCGHAWFQHHPELEADQEAESALYDPPPPLSKTGMSGLPSDLDWHVESDDPESILDAMGRQDRSYGAASDGAASDRPDQTEFEQTATAESPSPADLAPADLAPPDLAPADPAPAAKREIDPEAMRILREEVELETAQRALEQAQDAATSATPVTARRVARLKGIQPPPLPTNPAPQTPPPSARLPKVDTVSAALRSDDQLATGMNPPPKSGRGGTLTMLFLALAATAAYVFSPDLSARLPSIAQPLAQYVGFVDGLRDQLDILLPKVIAQGQALITLVQGWF